MVQINIQDSQKLRLMIARKGKSLKSFSDEVGISQTYLSQILNGNKHPSPATAQKIANGLGVNIETIFLIETKEKINQ